MMVTTKKILVVDDDPIIFKMVKVRLIKKGYEVLLATNGQEAVEVASLHMPHLIVMDFKMPIMNGLEAVAQIKRDEDLKNIPIIFTTSASSAFNQGTVKALGADAFIPKPYHVAVLINKIESLLKEFPGG